MGDLSGVEKPLDTKLIRNIFSRSGGEKSANSLFSGVTAPFSRAVGGLMLATSLSAMPMSALANDGANDAQVHTASVSTQAPQIQAMTLDEITRDKAFMKDRVILHFGGGIVDADLVAEGLSETGTPAIAISGGPDCGIRLIISGVSNEKFCFTQNHLDLGEVGGLAERMLPRIKAKQAQQALLQKQAALNLEN